jgi:glycosyltransferase involved in cell wall biosynthesis
LKVCHIISGLKSGGAEGVLYRLVSLNKNNSHFIISLTKGGFYSKKFEREKINFIELSFTGLNLKSFFNFLKLIIIILKKKPDIVQTWMYHADLIGSIAARLAGVSKVYWNIRNSNLNLEWSKKTTLVVMKLCAYLSNFLPTKIVCCSNKSLECHKSYGYDYKRMILILNGYDINKFNYRISTNLKLRNLFLIKKNEIVLGFVARWSRQKNFELILKSFSISISNNSNLRLILIGKNITNKNILLVKKLFRYKIYNKTILINETDKLNEILNIIDIGLFASKGNEGFPNVIAEKMLMGIPIISNEVGDAKMIIKNFGVVKKNLNYFELSRLINKYAQNYSLKKKKNYLHNRYVIKKSIERRYSINHMIAQYNNLWKS